MRVASNRFLGVNGTVGVNGSDKGLMRSSIRIGVKRGAVGGDEK